MLKTIKKPIIIFTALLSYIVFVCVIVALFSCNQNSQSTAFNNSTITKSDSIELRNLLIKIYRWREKNDFIDYKIIDSNQRNLRLDTSYLSNRLNALKTTNFFSSNFLSTYQKIGMRVDSLVKYDSNYFNAVDILFDYQDFNTWYGGQGDTPVFNNIKILDFKSKDSYASFKWTGSTREYPRDTISVDFIIENGSWKLNHLQYVDLENYK